MESHLQAIQIPNFQTYSSAKKDRLGNAIIFMAERIRNLSKTKLLKLLYFAEEFFVKKYKTPFLDIDFEIWQAGPVNRDVYIELSDNPNLLKDYIKTERVKDSTIVKPLKTFDDSEFSDNEIAILNFVVDNLGPLTAAKLVKLTHRPVSPWYILSKEKGLLDLFNSGVITSTEEKIPLDKFYCKDEWSKERYFEKKFFNSIVA